MILIFIFRIHVQTPVSIGTDGLKAGGYGKPEINRDLRNIGIN